MHKNRLLHLIDGLGQAGNSAGGVFPMQHAFAGGFVQSGSGPDQSGFGRVGILLLNSGAHVFDHIFDSGAHGAVTGGVLQALLMPLDSGFMVSQSKSP